MSQSFMIDLLGPHISSEERTILQNPHVGALLLFSRNMVSRQQLQELIAEIRMLRPDIFLAVDQEGGNVQRLQRQGFHALPALACYGKVYDLDKETGIRFAREYGELMAADVLNAGIELSLTPVLDCHNDLSTVIGQLERAFHAEPECIISLAGAFIEGMHKAGMPATGKHFPGHGSISFDSHAVTPICQTQASTLWDGDLKPFSRLIELDSLDAVMPAHVIYSAVDPDFTAGFSRIWLQDILRERLGFQGVILSDCLSMAGANIGDMQTRIQRAFYAGCDLVILCNQPRGQLQSILHDVVYQPTSESEKRLTLFKNKMRRVEQKESTQTRIAVAETFVSPLENQHLNKTASVNEQ